MENIANPITDSMRTNFFLTSKPHSLTIVKSIDIERKTLPKYAKSFAIMANSIVFEIERRKYPTFTMVTQMYKRSNHGSFL